MKFRALPIKNWIISKISTFGWTMVATRSLPELLESNPRFSITHVTKRTTWYEVELKIIQHYLYDMYKLKLPQELVDENTELNIDYWDLVSIDFFAFSKTRSKIKSQLDKLIKILSV